MSPGSPKIERVDTLNIQNNDRASQANQTAMHGNGQGQADGTTSSDPHPERPPGEQPQPTAQELEAAPGADPEEVEYQYAPRGRDFFSDGQYLKVKAAQYGNIHRKCFIILEHKEKHATVVLVEVYQTKWLLDQLWLSETAHRFTIALNCCRDNANHDGKRSKSVKVIENTAPAQDQTTSQDSQPESNPAGVDRHSENRERHFKNCPPEVKELLGSLEGKFQKAYMDEGIYKFVAPGSFVLLDYTSDIPYDCECADLGKLEFESLEQIRIRYLQNRARNWHISKDKLFPR